MRRLLAIVIGLLSIVACRPALAGECADNERVLANFRGDPGGPLKCR